MDHETQDRIADAACDVLADPARRRDAFTKLQTMTGALPEAALEEERRSAWLGSAWRAGQLIVAISRRVASRRALLPR